jgi:hypothetical protein
MRGLRTRHDDLVTVNEKHGDIFLIFLAKKRQYKPFGRGDLENLADRVHAHLAKRIYRMTCSYLRGEFRGQWVIKFLEGMKLNPSHIVFKPGYGLSASRPLRKFIP